MVEIASIVILGIFAQWIAWRLKLPAILPLILIGLAVGPLSSLLSESGIKWLEPIYNGKKGLFPGESLFYFDELAIGIILFEGALTLKREEVNNIGPSILNLISIGSTVTFIGATLLAHYIIGLNWSVSAFFAALIIVTGPTVIAPILRNLQIKKDVASVLKWESILIDPIGALAAVLVYEFIALDLEAANFILESLKHVAKIVLIGIALGGLGALSLKQFLSRNWVPHYLLNVFTLAFVLAIFVLSGILVPDSGLFTVVTMGLLLANMQVPHIKEILYFKESISVLLISVLFILLSANITIADLELILDVKVLILFLAVILVLRPIGVLLSTINSNLSLKEKLFISWVGPRGIVAAGIASLYGTKLLAKNYPDAEYITPLVFTIVLGTVLLNATTAGFIAKIFGVVIDKSSGILIIGANRAALLLAKYLKNNGREVALIDSNIDNVRFAKRMGLQAFDANVYTDDIKDILELGEMGYLMALTSSSQVNKFVLNEYKDDFGKNGAFRLITPDELDDINENPADGLFSHTDDYINFNEVARDYPVFNEVAIKGNDNFTKSIELINKDRDCIPMFIKTADNQFEIIPANSEQLIVNEGDKLIYMGKKLAALEEKDLPVEMEEKQTL